MAFIAHKNRSRCCGQKAPLISLTVRINAESQEQLDNIYRELSANERVLMML
jgi:putative lipoic acid-binding regulatory protein